MPLDFPSPATAGQVFLNWTFDGAKWVPLTATALPFTDTGRSLLHNGVFRVQQRGTGPWTASGYTADRWMIQDSLDTVNVVCNKLVDADRAQIGDESAVWSLANTFTGNANANAFNFLVQRIEGIQRLSGKTVTVSFWARMTSGSGLKVGVCFQLNYGTGGSPSAQGVVNGSTVSLTAAWARYSVTLALPSASGLTLGTNGDDNTELELWFSSGTTNAGRTGIGVQSGAIVLWGVQLEIGSVATPLAKRDPFDELALCMRFYQASSGIWGSHLDSGAYAAYVPLQFPVWFRATPTISLSISGGGNYSSVVAASAGFNVLVLAVNASVTTTVNFNYSYNASADL